MVQRLLAVLLMVALVGSVYAGDAKEVVVSSAEELKRSRRWDVDNARCVIPTNMGSGARKRMVHLPDRKPSSEYMDFKQVIW